MSLSDIEVYAFVGPAGTGKSHRATHVARQNGIDYIIDDGLVISRGRILAGRSAKSEINRLRAIRRAVFEFPDHRDSVVRYLTKFPPKKLMILATSEAMVHKITSRLGLNDPVKVIDITEIATPEEIDAALFERREKKQHVVPVAKAQIQQNFAGKLVGQIKGFFKAREKEDKNTIVRPLFSFNGKVTIDPKTIIEICRVILTSNKHIKNTREIDLETNDDTIILNIELDLTLGTPTSRNINSALSIAKSLQHKLQTEISYMTGMDVRKVNIKVNEIFL